MGDNMFGFNNHQSLVRFNLNQGCHHPRKMLEWPMGCYKNEFPQGAVQGYLQNKLDNPTTDISIREEVLNASLMECSIAVLQSAGLNDHTRWNMYIGRVVQTFRTELTDVKIEVGASLDQEKADKAARDAKIKSSNADVQMADATDTIRDAIKAEVLIPYTLYSPSLSTSRRPHR
ncbi:hypothetical protein B0H17DRAFT_1149006 [Mycena rosella]|uniref:Uncharacterized protein n=1 Tax=Mycena rosella TaxID=1033263 RepID=A0AAD7FUV2_MYCRO|nr:hypothetical protein B0H17DRAFT_1149006 [Mycena rosella]